MEDKPAKISQWWSRRKSGEPAKKSGQTQHYGEDCGILTSPTIREECTGGNEYRSYSRQVHETAAKFENRARWGCQPTRNIVELRAAFIMGGGLSAQWADGAKQTGKELEYVEQFIRVNRIDAGLALDWAKESQIEGKFLARLMPHRDAPEQIACRFVPWTQHAYVIVTDPQDYSIYQEAVYRVNGGDSRSDSYISATLALIERADLDTVDQIVRIPANEFVYATFGGRAHKVNDCPTRIGSILPNIEAVDKGLKDWREINRLFSTPTPVFTTETIEQANAMTSALGRINWCIGTAIAVGGGTYSLVGPPVGGMESIREEIVANMKVISAATGIPIHYLGFVDLMSNRSTAEDLSGIVSPATADDRATWQGWYNTLARKVLEMANVLYGLGFDPEAVEIRVNELSAAHHESLVKLWLPLHDSGVIDDEEMLKHLPGDVDVEAILDRKAEAKAEMMQQAQTIQRPPVNAPIGGKPVLLPKAGAQ